LVFPGQVKGRWTTFIWQTHHFPLNLEDVLEDEQETAEEEVLVNFVLHVIWQLVQDSPLFIVIDSSILVILPLVVKEQLNFVS
jgi:hypothetical protein